MNYSIKRTNQKGLLLKNKFAQFLSILFMIAFFVLSFTLIFSQSIFIYIFKLADFYKIIIVTSSILFFLIPIVLVYLRKTYYKILISENDITIMSDLKILNKSFHISEITGISILNNKTFILESEEEFMEIIVDNQSLILENISKIKDLKHFFE